MRDTTYATAQFTPGDPGGIQDWQAVQRYLQDLERRTALAVVALATGQHDILYREPERPRPGLVVIADGHSWNPGSGEGLYRYSSTWEWIFVG